MTIGIQVEIEMSDIENQPLTSGYDKGIDDELENEISSEDRILNIEPRKKQMFKVLICRFVYLVTAGITYVLLRWFPVFKHTLLTKRSTLSDCDSIFLTGFDENRNVVPIKEISVAQNRDEIVTVRFFVYRHFRYVFDEEYLCFRRTRGIENSDGMVNISNELLENGLESSVYFLRYAQHGENDINVEVKSYYRLLIDEVLHPFYVFQIFSVLLWVWETYYIYAGCIFVISIISVLFSLFETRRNMVNLHQMASFSCELEVFRDKKVIKVNSKALVPGDIFIVPPTGLSSVPCDAVLFEGSCIVNESSLTGESVPVTKLPLSNGLHFFEHAESKSIIHCGTAIVQTRSRPNTNVCCMVLRTGFNTVKGSLVRSILFPKADKFKFYEDAFKFVLCLAVLAIVGTVYSIVILARNGVGVWDVLPMALDVVTIVVPPALPAAMTVGTMFAVSRLKKANIYCIQPVRVNVSGKLDMIVFDKTGTLTEDGLDVWGVISVTHPTYEIMEDDSKSPERKRKWRKIRRDSMRSYNEDESDSLDYGEGNSDESTDSEKHFRGTTSRTHSGVSISSLASTNSMSIMYISPKPRFLAPLRDCRQLIADEPLAAALACCQSLVRIDGKLIGDPIDLKMFEAIGWELEELEISADSHISPNVVRPPGSNIDQEFMKYVDNEDAYMERCIQESSAFSEYGLVRLFPFSSKDQRMSVIMQQLGADHLQVFMKGAPEVVRERCTEESVPPDFHAILEDYTKEGYRCLALARRTLDIRWLEAQKINRDEIEKDMQFLGILVLQNRLKPESLPAIKKLKNANIDCVMCTGDNLLTAISVARECELLSSEVFVFVGELSKEGLTVNWCEANHRDWYLDTNLKPCSRNSAHPVPVNMAYKLAVNGRSFDFITKDEIMLKEILGMCAIYARMSPDQKTALVSHLEELDWTVGMCGDGANDCGALKAANVGISLSEAEASVAAPFTSRTPNIKCIPKLIREGRAALMTSFAVFKYMALYSFIQFASILILYWINSNLGDMQFLYADMILILPLSFLMGKTGAYRKLKKTQPPSSLVSPRILFSLFLQITVQCAFQVLGFIWLLNQSWYKPLKDTGDEDENTICQENTVIFYISSFQYITSAVAFSDSKPFRKRIYTNGWYLFCILFLSALTAYFLLAPEQDTWTRQYMGLVNTIPLEGRLIIALWVAVNFIICIVLEQYILPAKFWDTFSDKIWKKKKFIE